MLDGNMDIETLRMMDKGCGNNLTHGATSPAVGDVEAVEGHVCSFCRIIVTRRPSRICPFCMPKAEKLLVDIFGSPEGQEDG